MPGEKVAFTPENMKKCICDYCPVQTKSECAKASSDKAEKAVNGDEATLSRPEEIPCLYCSSGRSACGDLDYKEMCICGQCPVWMEQNLVGSNFTGYYCRDGRADYP